jgi:aspartate kinase
VITGYIAATESGIPTTLGRSGSDRTAAIVAAAIDADEVWIWTDVNGILTADPNLVPDARTLAEISYDEAATLARFGAEVLHPRTIHPLIENAIPLRIVNSFRPEHPGTRIVPESEPTCGASAAIISATGMHLLVVADRGERDRLRCAARTLQQLSDVGVDVRMFSQALSDSGLGLVVRAQDRDHVRSILGRGDASGDGSVVLRSDEAVAIVSVIGRSVGDDRGIASSAFAALGKHSVRVIAVTQTTDGDAVSFCIPASDVAETVRFLHRELAPDRVTTPCGDTGRQVHEGGST